MTTITQDMIATATPGKINGWCDTCDAYGPVIAAGDDLLCEKHAEKWLAKEAALALFNNDLARDRELETDPRFAEIWLRWNDRASVTGSFKEISSELEKLYNS